MTLQPHKHHKIEHGALTLKPRLDQTQLRAHLLRTACCTSKVPRRYRCHVPNFNSWMPRGYTKQPERNLLAISRGCHLQDHICNLVEFTENEPIPGGYPLCETQHKHHLNSLTSRIDAEDWEAESMSASVDTKIRKINRNSSQKSRSDKQPTGHKSQNTVTSWDTWKQTYI